MTDSELWEVMLENDIQTSLLIEVVGIEKTIDLYRSDDEKSIIRIIQHNEIYKK